MQFPILSFIVFTPIVAALIIFLIPEERKSEVRVAALAAAAFALVLSIWAYFAYDVRAGGYQFVEQVSWIPALGISYKVGLDGMNAPLVLLTGVVMFTGVLISWGIDDRPREFFTFLLSWLPGFLAFLFLLICSCCSSFMKLPSFRCIY